MKILQIEYARALAAFLVVCFHAEVTSTLPKYFGQGTFEFFRAGTSGVQIFFVISGFVMYVAHRSNPRHDPAALWSYGVKRFRRIYLPLWVVLSSVTLLYATGLFDVEVKLGDILLAFTVLPAEREGLLAVEWTLRHEVLFYFLFAAFVFDRRIGTVVLVGWGVIGPFVGLFVDAGWSVRFLLDPNHLLFLLGILLGRLHVAGRVAAGVSVPCFLLGSSLFVATWISVLGGHADGGGGPADLGYGIGAFLCLYAVSGLRRVPDIPFLTRLGAASYSLYLVHFPLVSLSCKIFTRIGHHEFFAVRVVYFVVTVAACVGLALLFHAFVERPLLRLASEPLRRWVEGRPRP